MCNRDQVNKDSCLRARKFRGKIFTSVSVKIKKNRKISRKIIEIEISRYKRQNISAIGEWSAKRNI